MSAFRSKLARYCTQSLCAQVMPIPRIVISAISRTPPKPMYPLELPFHPEQEPSCPPEIVPMEIGEYPPKTVQLPGAILANATGFLPPGYLLCNGAAVSRTTYSVLFKIIGTYYGDGDLINTFNLPNMSNDCNTNVTYIIKYDLTSDTVPYYPPDVCDGDSEPAPPCVFNIQILPYPIAYIPPPGTILQNTTPSLPDGYLSCNGAEVSRETYSILYNMIGTYYGVGDGITTFNLPNLSSDNHAHYIIRYAQQDFTGTGGTGGTTIVISPPVNTPGINAIQMLPYPLPYVPAPGTILLNSVNLLPEGYLACNGALVSRTTYHVLYDMIGTYYGSGDGTTTFKLPHLILTGDGLYKYIIRYDVQGTVLITPPVNNPDINTIQMLPYPLPYIPAPGAILLNSVNLLPEGYLACNGALVSRTTYHVLFDMIGTYYGAGDGSTTFKLPTLIVTGDGPYKYIIRYDVQNTVPISEPVNIQGINTIQMLPYPLPYVPAIGTILLNSISLLPDGYLACNGALVSRETFSALYDMIGTYYGSGNGSTTFALPNLIVSTDSANKYIIRYDVQGTTNTIVNPSNIQGVNTIQLLPYPLTYIPAVGTILINTINYVPVGYLACNGAAVPIETYNPLYDMIGTYYGTGNGLTTFNLPNLIGSGDPPHKYIIRYDLQIIPCVTVAPNLTVTGLNLDLNNINIQ